MGRLDGKVAVVTGGANGIGEGIVRRFVAEGARVVVADIQGEAAQGLVDELGDATTAVRVDVADETQVANTVKVAVDHFGQLDIMVNNAGILGAVGSIANIPGAEWQRSIDVLLSSVFYGIKHAARVMIPQKSGSIISTASTAGVRAGLGPHVYTAAKHAVVGLTGSVAPELRPHGVRANVIAPGGTLSAMTTRLMTGDHRDIEKAADLMSGGGAIEYCKPENIAAGVLFLASDEARFMNGHTLVMDSGGEVIGDRNGQFVEMGNKLVQEGDRTGI